jgi:magnesium-transporting ATPase (P-type)
MNTIYGLTESEVQARRQQGLGNDTAGGPSRSYWDIARANLFTLFNNILFSLGVALVALGRYTDALTSIGLGLINALISFKPGRRKGCGSCCLLTIRKSPACIMKKGSPNYRR